MPQLAERSVRRSGEHAFDMVRIELATQLGEVFMLWPKRGHAHRFTAVLLMDRQILGQHFGA
jgi:hypothetical protein